MSTAQELIAQGHEEGHREGHREGREQERRDLAKLLLTEKFGELSQETRDRLEQASADVLQLWCKRVLKAERLEDVFAS